MRHLCQQVYAAVQQQVGKWGRYCGRTLLGTGDIQSLADLGNNYELVRKMRIVPIQSSDFIGIAFPGVIPALPLAATVMVVGEILKGVLRLLG
jgi:hypothetical protein